ncbi:MAG: hypothetical protein ABJL17_07940 [Parvibaculum sp.]
MDGPRFRAFKVAGHDDNNERHCEERRSRDAAIHRKRAANSDARWIASSA